MMHRTLNQFRARFFFKGRVTGLIGVGLCFAFFLSEPVLSGQSPINDLHSIQSLMESISERFKGDVLKIELEWEDDYSPPRPVYEVKLLSPQGRVIELEVDAKTLELLEVEGDDDEEDAEHR